MSPFIAIPSGLSSETLALLDRALGEVWREQLRNKLPAATASKLSPRETPASVVKPPGPGARAVPRPTPRAPWPIKGNRTSR